MPKMKSHSGMGKRVKVTAKGKLLRLQARRKSGAAFASTPIRSTRHHRRQSGDVEFATTDAKRVKRLLGR